MKKLLLALALLLAPAAASAQCTGVFTNGTVCGNATGSNNTPRMTPSTSFSPSMANPSAAVGLSVINGSASTAMRSDAAPPLSASIQSSLTGTNHGVLVGTGIFGFGSTASGTLGIPLIGQGSSTDPVFGTAIVGGGGTGQTSFTANLPLIGNGSGSLAQGTRSGNTTAFGTTAGTLTNGNCVKIDANGNLVDAGVTCASGSNVSGFYTLQYISGAWTCTNPTGGAVSVVGSTTSGLQECITAMQSAKAGNFRAICPNPAASTPITATTTVTFGPSAGASYNLDGCWLNTTANPGVRFETLNFGAVVSWPGIIRCTTGSPCVDFNPSQPDPLFGSYGIGGAYIRLGSVMTGGCSVDAGQSAGVHFNPNGGVAGSHISAIYGSRIEIGFLDGFDGTHNCFSAGVGSDSPTNVFAAFGQNYIYIGYIQGFGQWGVTNGTTAVTQATQALATNHWDIGSIGSSTGATTSPLGGFLELGFLDQIYANISINSGTLSFGIAFNSTTANGNWFVLPQLAGATAILDNSTTVKNYGFTAGGGYKTGGTW